MTYILELLCGDLMPIGERIAALRKEKNISQVQLAKALEVSRQAVSKWENDLTAPDTINLIRLADLLETDTEYLATGIHSKIKSPPTVITMVQKVDNVVEKVIEKPVPVEKIVEVERFVEVPRIKKVIRVKYLRNPIEFAAVALAGLIIGFPIGIFI